MPFSVVHRDGEWLTINSHTGDIKGHHGKNKAKAERQLRALYANSADVSKKSEIDPRLLQAYLQQKAIEDAQRIKAQDIIANHILASIVPDVATQNIVLNGGLRLLPAENGGDLVSDNAKMKLLIDSYMQRFPASTPVLDDKLLHLMALEQALNTLQPTMDNSSGTEQDTIKLLEQLAATRGGV